MKVLICGEALHLGGAETVSIDLANALAERGVAVAYSAAPGPLDARLGKGVRFEVTPPLSRTGALAFARGLAAVLRGFRPDVLHAQGATLALAARTVSSFAVRSRPAIVLTHHSTSYRRAPEFVSALLLRAACDQIVAISSVKQRQFLAMGFPERSVSFIPNFVDCRAIADAADRADRAHLRAELGIDDTDRVVAMIGRMIPGKGFDVFARALASCAARVGRPLVGLAIGDGPERARLERLSASLPGPARFVFAGYRRDVTALLGLCSAVLFPSQLTEVLPMTLIEASAAGVPIVCSDIPGNREVVSGGVNGDLAGPSEQSYADALARILVDESRARAMGDAGRRLALEKFDEQVVVPRILALYAEVVARVRGSG
ncbi:MAG: glycosyltransferase family 4 protein [Myxococcota bacterium]